MVSTLTLRSSQTDVGRRPVGRRPVGHDGAVPDAAFVYGTLMPDRLRWSVLAPFALDRVQTVAEGRLWDTGHGWPAARFDPADEVDGSGPVPGWLIRWAPADAARILTVLDELEGPTFRRVVITTPAGEAWSYEARVVGLAWARIDAWTHHPDR